MNTLQYNSVDVIAYVVYWCKANNINVDATKAQKLLYCCYGAVLAQYDERLTDEHPAAWLYGPVFAKAFAAVNKNRLTVGHVRNFRRNCDDDTLLLIDKTLTTFAKYTTVQLSKWASVKHSPWDQASAFAALDDRAIAISFKPYLDTINDIDNVIRVEV